MSVSHPAATPIMKTLASTLSKASAGALLAILLSGCASDQQRINAINAVNQGFRVEYEKLLVSKGTRVYKLSRADAFMSMRVALASIGMQTEQQDVSLGYLAVAAGAPLPLTDAEWRSASEADLPLLRRLVQPHVGIAANFVQFEPQGLDVVINATVIEVPGGTEVSITVRLRETAPAKSGWPRREYVSPRVMSTGLDRIFGAFERELRAGPKP